jgi:hypothetical protein
MSYNDGVLFLNEKEYVRLKKLHEESIKSGNEKEANEFWLCIQVYEINRNFLLAFENLKSEEYYKAWREFDRIEHIIGTVENNFPLDDLVNVEFIKQIVPNYMALFPYKLFLSRETIIMKSKCSICGQEIKIRNRCKHRVGKLYSGKICSRIEEVKIIGASLVENPVDRCSVVNLEEDYDFSCLRSLVNELETPFKYFSVTRNNA